MGTVPETSSRALSRDWSVRIEYGHGARPRHVLTPITIHALQTWPCARIGNADTDVAGEQLFVWTLLRRLGEGSRSAATHGNDQFLLSDAVRGDVVPEFSRWALTVSVEKLQGRSWTVR